MVIKISYLNVTHPLKSGRFENRSLITPEICKRILNDKSNEFEVLVEKGLGASSNYSDSEFQEAGAKLVSKNEALAADFVCFLQADLTAFKQLKSGQTAVGLFNSFSNSEIVKAFPAGVNAVDVNKLPRQLSTAQSMDALTSQASVAGYKAALLAANEFAGFFPMLTTAAGTIKPASVLVLGAGIAGLQAIGTAKRLGAVVTAFDVRPAAEEEVKSLGANFLDLAKYGAAEVVEALKSNQGEGGYARKLTADESKQQLEATNLALKDFDIVITTAQVPGSKPPQFISTSGIKNMKSGSVIVDLAASELGGNVEGSKPGETVLVNDVSVIGAPDLASTSPKAASALIARNYFEIVTFFANYDGTNKELDDMLIAGHLYNKNKKEEK